MRNGGARRAARPKRPRVIGRLAIPSRRLTLGGFVLVGLMLLAAGVRNWRGREDVFASYRRETTNLAIALAAQAARTVQAVDLVVRETQRETLVSGADNPQQFKEKIAGDDIHRFLARHLKNLPQADFIGIVAADGALINASNAWPPPRMNLFGKDWFVWLRDRRDAGLLLTHPVRVPQTGAWTFFLARRVQGRDGAFLGVVVAGIEADYFTHFYREISLQPGEAIDLFARDGMLIARYPPAAAAIGTKLPLGSPWYRSVAEGGGSYRTAGRPDDPARLVSVVPLRDYPLVVTVGMPQAAVLAEWWHESVAVAIGALSLALGFTGLLGALAARSRGLERHSAELAQSAEALRRSEARFRDFALTSSDWFWETDEEHRITFVSDGVCAFGHDPADFIGRSRLQVAATSDRDRAKWERHMAVLQRHEPFRNFVYKVKPGDEPERTVSISGKPFCDAAGSFLGYHGTGRDITEEYLAQHRLQEAKAAAEAANLTKSQFLANVSHELRTPLNAIIGFAEMLEMGMAGELKPAQRENVKIIHTSAHHLHQIINDILDLAKVDAGKLDLCDEAGVEPRAVVEGCITFVKERANEAGISLSVAIEPGLPPLIADALRLKQILLNLLSNAVKFSAPGDAIVTGACRLADGGIAFEVRDSGPGMTEDEIQLALEPFGQVDGGLARRHDGAGLGLPIARHLAALHGGTLEINSRKGVGTTVVVTLPAARVMEDAAGAQPAMAEIGAAA